MEFLTGWYFLLDAIILLMILALAARGAARGAFMSFSGASSLAAGLFGGVWLAQRLTETAARTLFLPWATGLFKKAEEGLGFSGLGEGLSELLQQMRLPSFLHMGTAEEAIASAAQSSANLLDAAAEIVARRLAAVLIFFVAFLLIMGLVRLLFRAVNLVFQLPVIGLFNRVCGGLLGAAGGVLLVTMLLWAACRLLPSFTLPGGILSETTVRQTYVTNWFFTNLLPYLP